MMNTYDFPILHLVIVVFARAVFSIWQPIFSLHLLMPSSNGFGEASAWTFSSTVLVLCSGKTSLPALGIASPRTLFARL